MQAGATTIPPIISLAPPAPAMADVAGDSSASGGRLAVRVWSTFTFVSASAMLGVGLMLKPDPAGTGTHQQLGLPACGWLHVMGLPCPMCGCTTAVSHFAHGNIVASFLTQPFGFAVGLVAAVLIPMAFIGMVRGKWIGPSMFTLGWYWRSLVFGSLGLLLVAWIYKIILVKSGITF